MNVSRTARQAGAGGAALGESSLALPDEVVRESLLDRLDRRWQVAVTTVVAPGGFGKSTLLGQMLRRRPSERLGVDVVLRLGSNDRDASVLAGRILERLHADADPGRPEHAAGVVAGAIAGLAPVRICIGLDDCHLLTESSSATDLVRRLLDELPANANLLLVGRSLPPLSVARHRAADRVIEIDADDLAFTDGELRRLAASHGMQGADLADIGGWPALTRLAIVAGHRAAADYLWEELVASLDPEQREALAVLTMVGGAVPADLTELGLDRPIAAESLTTLPLVSEQLDGAIRPHDLWWDVLDRLADPDRLRVLAGGVIRLLAERERIDDAIDLAARVGDADAACRTVLEALKDGTMTIGASTARRWYQLLPSGLRHRPEVRLLEAVMLRLEEGRERGESLVEEAIAGFAERGDSRAETIAMTELIARRWERADIAGLLALYERAKAMNATRGTGLLDEFVATVEVTVADLSGDPAGALARLDALRPVRNDRTFSVLVNRWRSSLLLLLGRSDPAVAAVESLLDGQRRPSEGLGVVLALTRWQHGDPGPMLLRRPGQSPEARAPNARDRFVALVYARVVDASLGRPQVPVDRRELARAGSGHGRDEA